MDFHAPSYPQCFRRCVTRAEQAHAEAPELALRPRRQRSARHPGAQRSDESDADEKLIAAEIERDPAIGRAEWLAEWRDDLASFVSRELIEAAVDSGVSVRPCIPGVRYHCMIDPSGGVGDSMTLGIAHRETDGRVVLDAVVERPAPFHAQAIVTECCAAAK